MTSRGSGPAPARALTAGTIAALAHLGAHRALAARPPRGPATWERTNFAGRRVSLTGGAAPALGAVAGAAAAGGRTGAAAALAGAAGGLAGLLDDLGEAALPEFLGAPRRAGTGPGTAAPPGQPVPPGQPAPAKGLRGHLGALREGRVTTGALKIAGIGAGALGAACLLPPDRPRGPVARLAGVGLSTVVVAGTANLLNLLDLRPGRALKAGALLALPALAHRGAASPAAAVLGAGAAALPADLGERTMLGDTGANALGAVLGTALAAGNAPPARAALAAGIVALTLASERVSFSAVIARTPGLRELDALGRRP